MTMEKRAILAAVLMAALLMLYQAYFAPSPAPEATRAKAPAPQEQAPPAQPPTPPGPPSVEPPRPAGARVPQRTAAVTSPLYRAVVSSEGGKLQEWTLHYRGDKPLVVVGEQGPLGLVVAPGPAAPGAIVSMAMSPESLSLGPGSGTGDLVLAGESDGLRVKETLRFQADTYTVDALVRVENAGSSPRSIRIELPWMVRRQGAAGAPTEKFTGQRPTEVVWAADGHVHRIHDLAKVGSQSLEGRWIALGSTWYLAALMPRSPGFGLTVAADSGGGKNGVVQIAVRATPTVAPGQAWEGHVRIYVGPKEYDRLRAQGLEGTLDFGGFPVPRSWGGLPMEWLGVPILQLMNWTYRYVGNYGIAIILLTLVTKVLFYPLTVKSMRSMKAMQALQPQVNALRSKYKNDPRKLQEETLALYRKHKVNPMGGCLPMVAQIPIFYALYLALSVSVELQNAAFLCFGRVFGIDVWICDLASHDPTYVLPILMGITMFVQQKMTPTAGDPRQQRMMLLMPFVFTFMFLNLPSGLVLYWTVSNILQIFQQWLMDRPRAGAIREPKQVARA
jgi:YidC/Oxa1 family membrane protein insertase